MKDNCLAGQIAEDQKIESILGTVTGGLNAIGSIAGAVSGGGGMGGSSGGGGGGIGGMISGVISKIQVK